VIPQKAVNDNKVKNPKIASGSSLAGHSGDAVFPFSVPLAAFGGLTPGSETPSLLNTAGKSEQKTTPLFQPTPFPFES
jgi:hypothetical protein